MNKIRVENKEKELTLDAKKAILTEWKINLIIIERANVYHKGILNKRNDTFLNPTDTIGLFDVHLIPGLDSEIQKETITSNSTSLALGQDVDFDLKTRLTINQISAQQELLVNASKRITESFLSQRELFDIDKTNQNYLIFYSLLEQLIQQEDSTIIRLKEAINEFEN